MWKGKRKWWKVVENEERTFTTEEAWWALCIKPLESKQFWLVSSISSKALVFYNRQNRQAPCICWILLTLLWTISSASVCLCSQPCRSQHLDLSWRTFASCFSFCLFSKQWFDLPFNKNFAFINMVLSFGHKLNHCWAPLDPNHHKE